MRRVALIIGLTAALVPAGCTVKVGGKTLGLGSGDKDEKKPEGGGAGESSASTWEPASLSCPISMATARLTFWTSSSR